MVLQFVFNESAYGLGTQTNCGRDYIKVYDGIEDGAALAVKLCGSEAPAPFTVSSTEAKVVFRGSSLPHSDGQTGVSVDFYTIEQGAVMHI